MTRFLWELRGSELESLDTSLMFLPVGAIERHGKHLPLGTDTLTSLYIAEKVASKVGGIILPPVWYGSCIGMREHKGTFDISQNVLAGYVCEILLEAWRNGAKLVVVINGHGGNTHALHYAAREAARKSDLAVVVVDWWREIAVETRSSLFEKTGHAGEDETSAMLVIRGDLVDMRLAESFEASMPPIRVYSRRLDSKVYKHALTGDASKASIDKGEKWLKAVVEELADKVSRMIEELQNL